jgi:hypothetical protein
MYLYSPWFSLFTIPLTLLLVGVHRPQRLAVVLLFFGSQYRRVLLPTVTALLIGRLLHGGMGQRKRKRQGVQ